MVGSNALGVAILHTTKTGTCESLRLEALLFHTRLLRVASGSHGRKRVFMANNKGICSSSLGASVT